MGGAAIGALDCFSLRKSIESLVAGRSPVKALALGLARFAVLAATLGGIAKYAGASPLLAAAMGTIASRLAMARLESAS
jgi:hypothetical protein